MVEIAVIGAGSSGLVTARHLLRAGLRACLFERRPFVGGAWSAGVRDGISATSPQMWEHLTPNLSKYTCAFSDHPWPTSTPAFPSLTQMDDYLQSYADQYVLKESDTTVHYECTVTQVKRVADEQYTVEWCDPNGALQSQEFDGVVVATGFFAAPAWPESLLDLCQDKKLDDRIIHSMHYRSPSEFENQTVAVVGGSFSAHEISADLCQHGAARVVNVVGHHATPYVLPKYLPSTQEGGDFAPLDTVLYRRPQAASLQSSMQVVLTPETTQERRDWLARLMGPRKLAQAKARGLQDDNSDPSTPPTVSISDDYLDLVIDDRIEIHQGKLIGVSAKDSVGSLDLQLDNGSTLSGMDNVICCTGYRSSLGFLEANLLEILQYDKTDSFAPFQMCWDTLHPKLPRLGFVGMYSAVYFGIMELQARLLAGLWSGQVPPLSDTVVQQALTDARSIREHRPRAQFPRFDYMGMADTLAWLLDLVPDPQTYGAAGRMVTPAFYQTSDPTLAQACQTSLDQETTSKQPQLMPRLVFRALIGKWSFDREIKDHLTGSLQEVHGEINFSLQKPDYSSLRYREDGVLDLANGKTLQVHREYDYLIDSTLDIHFVEFGKRAHLFLSLMFQSQDEDGYWVATNDHLCIQDLYKGTFKVAFDGVGASKVIMSYRVEGPQKDYESVTQLRPVL